MLQDIEENQITELEDFIPAFEAEDEELERIAKANLEEEDFDDFSSLDSLLTESIKLQGAKFAKAKGKKLSAEQIELLESARIAREAQVWQVKSQYLVVRSLHCPDCNVNQRIMIGKYAYKVNARGSRVLEKLPSFNPSFPKFVYYVPDVNETCPLCEMLREGMEFGEDLQASDLLDTL